VQLLPVEPTTVYEAGPDFWTEIEDDDDRLLVDIRRPDTTNWGYDVVINGMAAINPSLLETAPSGRTGRSGGGSAQLSGQTQEADP
jgi:hypothetical protein